MIKGKLTRIQEGPEEVFRGASRSDLACFSSAAQRDMLFGESGACRGHAEVEVVDDFVGLPG